MLLIFVCQILIYWQVIVADSEKENIGHQSLRNRQTAGQAKANLLLVSEQSAVNIAHLEAKVSEGTFSSLSSLSNQ